MGDVQCPLTMASLREPSLNSSGRWVLAPTRTVAKMLGYEHHDLVDPQPRATRGR